jgi:hypothetical protein
MLLCQIFKTKNETYILLFYPFIVTKCLLNLLNVKMSIFWLMQMYSWHSITTKLHVVEQKINYISCLLVPSFYFLFTNDIENSTLKCLCSYTLALSIATECRGRLVITPTSHSGETKFKFILGDLLSLVMFSRFYPVPQKNVGIVPWTRPWLLHSISFRINYSLFPVIQRYISYYELLTASLNKL